MVPSEYVANLEFDPELVHGHFVLMASAFMRSPKFSATAKVLYGVLLTYAGQRCVAWPGQATLCEAVGVSDKTLKKALAELEAAGLVLSKRGGDGKTTRYTVQKWHGDSMETPVQTRRNSGSEFQTRKISGSRLGEIPDELYSGEIDTACGGNAHAHEAAAASESSLNRTPKPSAAVLPEGTPLPQVAPEVLARVPPEELLERFDLEFPEHRKRIEDIARRNDVRFPRRVQAKEALALIAEARRRGQRSQEPKQRAGRSMPPADWLERNAPGALSAPSHRRSVPAPRGAAQ